MSAPAHGKNLEESGCFKCRSTAQPAEPLKILQYLPEAGGRESIAVSAVAVAVAVTIK